MNEISEVLSTHTPTISIHLTDDGGSEVVVQFVDRDGAQAFFETLLADANDQPNQEAIPAFRCIACGRPLDNIDQGGGNQPSGGLEFTTAGHYGTTVFDPMDGSRLAINVCDPCLKFGISQGRTREYQAGAQGSPRPMTGFFESLTPEQKEKALAYDGPENHGSVELDTLFGFDRQGPENGCTCASCWPRYPYFRVCRTCGNKRCPKAENHVFTCTGSNEPGQAGVIA